MEVPGHFCGTARSVAMKSNQIYSNAPMLTLGAHPSLTHTKSSCFQEFLSASVFGLFLTDYLCIPNVLLASRSHPRESACGAGSFSRLEPEPLPAALASLSLAGHRGQPTRDVPICPDGLRDSSLWVSWEMPFSDQLVQRCRVQQSCWISVTQPVLAP